MKTHCKILMLGTALLATTASQLNVAQAQPSTAQIKATVDANFDRLFMIHAAQGNMAEVMTGNLALKKSKNSAVRNVAQTIVKGHSAAQKDLLARFKTLNIAPPKDPGVANKATYAMLSKLSGAAFDKAFMAAQVDAHEKTITLFEHEIMAGRVPAAKAHAQAQLPGILMHTGMIYDAAVKVGAPGVELRPKQIRDAVRGSSTMKMKM